MLQLAHYPFDLAFEYPFTIAKGTKTHQPTLVVSLALRHIKGYGEAPAINYYDVTVPHMIEVLQSKKKDIEKYALTDPQRFWHFLHHLIPGENFLICALDMAAWDLFSQLRRQPLYQLLRLQFKKPAFTDYTIGIDTAEEMVAKMQAHPWPLYKVKLARPEHIDLLRALRAETDAPFRIDINEGWTFEEAKTLLPDLEKLGVTLIEQPLKKDAWDEMKELKAISSIPLFADESCIEEHDIKKCAEGFHGINIKLTKCGGLTPAMRMIHEARQLGMKVMIGSMNESTIGSAAIAHLSPLLDEMDADGPLLLKEDIATGLRYDKGNIFLSRDPGLGIRFLGKKVTK